ncbi:MAG: hypothetical protein MK132_19495 [Lentisphaerales bacterium]|nr:hypothetical protein [Lentisphaerales bacterium]
MKRFTFLELLIVVAIIGVLTSILLPSLANARGVARRSVCMANYSQVLKATSLYVVKNNNFFQQTVYGQSEYSWDDLLAKGNYDGRDIPLSQLKKEFGLSEYFGGNEVYQCPEDNPTLWDFEYRSYGMNTDLIGLTENGNVTNSAKPLSRLTHPAETIALSEAYSSAPDGGKFFKSDTGRSVNWNKLGRTIAQGSGLWTHKKEFRFNHVGRHYRPHFSVFGLADMSVRFMNYQKTAGDSGKDMMTANQISNTWFDAIR